MKCIYHKLSIIALFIYSSNLFAIEGERVEFWYYRTEVKQNNYAEQVQVRYYKPFEILDTDWSGSVQISSAAGYVVGNNFKNSPISQWEPGNTRFTGLINTPKYNGLKYIFGVRYYTAIGNPDPAFNTEQEEIGPELGFDWKDHNPVNFSISRIKPVIRYMNGFNPERSNVRTVKVFEFLPELNIRLNEFNSILLWNHNGLLLNERNGKYVIPLDLQFEHDFNKSLGLRIGGTLPVYDELHKNIWQGYTSFIVKF